MERKCGYRNCSADISDMRKDAKFCSRNCKTCESKYKRRKNALLEKYMAEDMKRVEEYKRLMKIIKGEDNY
jgi:hypothetical protein